MAVNHPNLTEIIHKLGEREQRILTHFLHREPVARDSNAAFAQRLTFGERLADKVAAFGGSWAFILLFLVAMAVWMLLNIESAAPFDPFPFILLNLLLSCVAALQAPVIMMSQNRQADKDRLDAHNDYEVNLKAELEILALHSKINELRESSFAELMAVQDRQLALLERLEALLLERGVAGGRSG